MGDNHSARPDLEPALVEFALDAWRFAKTFERMTEKLDAGQSRRFQSQCKYFTKRLNETLGAIDLQLVDLSGQQYEEGMAASALNLEDFAEGDVLLVDQMVEPIIMGPSGLVRMGTVMLRKVRI